MKNVAAVENKNTGSARAVTRYIRISPRKMRLVLETIKWKPVFQAFSILANTKKKAARLVTKTLKSAVANAKQKQMDEDRLIVRLAFADGGPSLKRFLPRAMGRADNILKRTTHLTVVVEEGKGKFAGPKNSGASEGKALKSTKEKKKKEAAQAA